MVTQLKRRYDLYLRDILDAIDRIMAYTEGMDREAFEDEPLVRDAVLRNVQVLGEAVDAIPEEVQQEHDTVPWRDVKDFRNVVVHAYWKVDTGIVWEIVSDRLPPLREQVEEILREEEG